ncbi:MAG: hypothetical protein N2Z21_06330 [Candidatus Sumerlaeaceae bacterium]|nr:hypothetical protein [Candidatus Sumerlaeaceae bacterium]
MAGMRYYGAQVVMNRCASGWGKVLRGKRSALRGIDGWGITSYVLALVAAWSFAFVPLRASQDEWWHLKAGQWIVRNGRLPVTDIFTYTGENLRWYNHEWLAQVLFYKVFAWGEGGAIGGLRGLIGFKSLVVVATFALVGWTAARHCGSWRIAGLVTLVAADVARRTIYPRPPILSYLLLAAFVALLWEWKAGRLRERWLWLLPVATVLWANLHGMVPLAVVAVGCFAGGEFLEWLFSRWCALRARHEGRERAWRRWGQRRLRGTFLLGCVALTCAVAAMASPSGWHIFFLGHKFTADPTLQRVIAEMLPTPGPLVREVRGGIGGFFINPLYLSFWATVVLLVALMVQRAGLLRAGADYFLVGFFLYQALMHVRLLPLYAVACAPTLAWLLASVLRRLREPLLCKAWHMVPVATVVLFCVYVFVVAEPPPQTFFRRNLELLRGKDREAADYPTPVMQFVIRARLPDRMFSEINYCGYMIWWLSPEHHKLFTDNRFDLFGSQFYLEEATVVHGVEREEARLGRGWQEILDEYGVNFIVISRQAPLNAKLRASGRWDEIYYWIPEGHPPNVGFNVWLRREERFREVKERALALFREERPTALLPDQFEAWISRNSSGGRALPPGRK